MNLFIRLPFLSFCKYHVTILQRQMNSIQRVGGFRGNLKSPAFLLGASQVMLVEKNLPANAEDVRDMGSIPGLGRPLEEGMATHSSILAWRIPWTEEPEGLQSIGSQRVGHD